MTDISEKSSYDQLEDRLIVKTSFDNREVLKANMADRNAAPEHGRYKGNMCHVGRVHMGDVVRLKNLGYDLLSPDPDQVKRALMYIQGNEKHLLTVPGNPIAKRKQMWV